MHCSGSTLFYSILRKSCSRKRKVKEINEVAMAWTLLCRFFIPISYQANFLLTIGWSCSLFSICYCSHGSWCSRVHQKHIEACWFKYWAFLYDWQSKKRGLVSSIQLFDILLWNLVMWLNSIACYNAKEMKYSMEKKGIEKVNHLNPYSRHPWLL